MEAVLESLLARRVSSAAGETDGAVVDGGRNFQSRGLRWSRKREETRKFLGDSVIVKLSVLLPYNLNTFIVLVQVLLSVTCFYFCFCIRDLTSRYCYICVALPSHYHSYMHFLQCCFLRLLSGLLVGQCPRTCLSFCFARMVKHFW